MTSSYATKVVDDNFAINGTLTTDADYFGSSSTSAIEINTNSIGLVSGTSGRQIHGVFETQTLENPGDSLRTIVTFTTPATISPELESDDIRIGLFDHLERNTPDQLGQNTNYSTASPNPLFSGLPGFYLELDVESSDPTTDLDIRRSDPSTSGRLLATGTGFTAFGSGPDVGYTFEANTQYTVVFEVTRTASDALEIRADFGGNTQTSTDLTPASFSFGMLAMGSSAGAFGSINQVGTDPNIINDNGIDIDSFSVEFIPSDTSIIDDPVVDEPIEDTVSVVVNDVFAINGTDPTITDASYFASSTSNAIEFNADTIGVVSGTSSRQIHSLFETQTLEGPGDFLEATISFTTPDTIGVTGEDGVDVVTGEEIRIALFDHLERTSATELGQNTSYSTANPNPVYEGLPGFYLELDVESADLATDLDIRRSDPSITGRSLSTSSGFSSLGNGPNVGYVFEPNTQYTVALKVTRTASDTLEITADFAGATFTAIDTTPASFNFGMLAINVSSGAFGTSNVPGELNNGIDLDSFTVQVTESNGIIVDNGPEGTGAGSDVTANLVADDFANNGTVGAEDSYFTSNNNNAIEFNSNSVGLVSGQSGRHIHSLFPTQSLDLIGDKIRASLSFTTPDTVSTGGEEVRIGIFDTLGRDSSLELAGNQTFSSANPNPLFSDLPGYYVEIDVEQFSSSTDLEIGRSNPSTTGRLLNTTSGFTRENGPSIGYTIQPNTDYTVYLTVERTANGFDVSANFLGRSFNIIDDAPLSTEFGMLAINVSSGAFGSTNVPGEPDNGMDITSLDVEFIRPSVVNDNLAVNGTAETDIDYFASSSSNAIEINSNSIGLVTGSSSRQIHGLFDSQSLINAGDILETSITFVTPETVATSGEDLRIGIFDTLGRTGADQLGQNTSFSTANPNLDFADLPGYYLELDVEAQDPATDLDIRRSNPTESGRLLTTTGGFTAIANSDDLGYVITGNTEYTVDLTIVRTETDGLEITADFLGNSFTVVDENPASFDFGMLAFFANSFAVGSSNAPGTEDNGIDITNITVDYTRFFSPEVVELPEVELPLGDHPEVEFIPTLPEGLFTPPTTTERVLELVEVTKTVRFFGRTFTVTIRIPRFVERTVVADLTDAEIVALHFGLDANAQPWDNFELNDWAIDTPNGDNGPITTAAGNVFGNGDTLSARTQDFHFIAGEQFPGSEPFFFTGSDGAMVFKSVLNGERTSENTSFARSELREMLRAGNRSFSTQGVGPNNWALGHQPEDPNIGAIGGRLTATLSIDQVTSTGSAGQVGRVIIAQIHAEDDEALRLYYRKLPGNTRGGIYAVHEVRGNDLSVPNAGSDINFDIIGSLADDAVDPIDGIAPGELFSYEVTNIGSELEIIIRSGDSDGPIIGELIIDMNTANDGGSTGYDVIEEWNYFKLGAYSQNNTGWGNDFDQVRFYRIENTHTGESGVNIGN